tara:strand:+ start:306 stop:572 length:267 start_codon:yes stop_codon:yes gene_type:complete
MKSKFKMSELGECNEGLVEEPLFLKVRSRDTVLVGEDEICKVLSFVGGSRNPDAPSLFQVANVDTGEIKMVHAAEVKEIVCSWEEQQQ